MKNLDQFNEERLKHHLDMQEKVKPKYNGIACPKCAHEMMDTDPRHVLPTDPPSKKVNCPRCGFESTRYE